MGPPRGHAIRQQGEIKRQRQTEIAHRHQIEQQADAKNVREMQHRQRHRRIGAGEQGDAGDERQQQQHAHQGVERQKAAIGALLKGVGENLHGFGLWTRDYCKRQRVPVTKP